MSKTYEIEILIKTFTDFKNIIEKYKYPEELFGKLTGKSIDSKLIFLKEKSKDLLQDYSADKYAHYNDKDLFNISSDVARIILELKKAAEEQIKNETYGTSTNSVKNFATIKGKSEYQISDMILNGDFSNVYNGEFNNNGTIEKITVKISKSTDDEGYLLDDEDITSNNESLLNEINILKYINLIKNPDFDKVRLKHYPILIDDFKLEDRQVSVSKYNVTGYDLITLKEKFKNGVPLYHACWIMERMLSATGHLNFNKVLLGNILPSSVYVFSDDHNIRFTDYTFSLANYTLTDKKYIGFNKNYTAPEVIEKATPHPRTDLYSIGMNIIYILGGDVEKRTLPASFKMLPNQKINGEGIERIKIFISLLTNKNPRLRLDDAWKAYHQLKQLRKDTFPKTEFIQFEIPI